MPETDKERADRLEAEARESRGSRSGAPSDEGRGVAEKMLRRFRGKATEALAQMADENKELRIDRRELRDKLKKFETPGTVILGADEAKEWEGFKALGKKAADVKKDLDTVSSLTTKVAEQDRRMAAEEAAPLAGYNAVALRELVADKKLTLSFKTETKDGKEVRIPMVKPDSDDKAQPVPLVDYAKQNLATYLPSLTAKAPSNGASTTASTTAAGKGTQMVEQSAGSSTAPNGDKPRPVAPGNTYMTPSMRQKASQNPTT